MNKRVRQVSYFLFSQYFSDGLRTTLSVLLPALAWAQAGQLQTGLAMSLGALNVSLSDAPGPVAHRRNGMAATAVIGCVVTLITGFARLNPYVLAAEILLFSFFFSMFAIWGNRAASVGTAALLIMILMLDRPLDTAGVLEESGLVLAGSIWYTIISLLVSQLRPYLLAKQALGQCIHEIARLMTIKADFYSTKTQLEEDYRRFIAQQVVVNEKQDAVREVLYKSRRIVTESTQTGRLLLLTFVDVVDLYDQVIAMYYDYPAIRDRFGQTVVLDKIAHLIRLLATQLDHIGLAIQSPLAILNQPDKTAPLIEDLKQSIDALGDQEGSTLVLKKVLVSLRTVGQRLTTLQANLSAPPAVRNRTEAPEYNRFVSHQEINPAAFRDNLSPDSLVFRHSARVAIAMLLGFSVTKFLPYGHHSYWVLLTISVILKPAFSLTKQRNIERIAGTLIGGVVGVLILRFIPDKTTQFGLMAALMLGTYSAQRVNYQVMVICLTPFILILFSFLGVSYLGVAEERFLDTLLGGVIALVAGYAFFPQWESEQLLKPMQATLRANVRYVQLLLDSLSGSPLKLVDYKLARKEIFVTSANLGAAFDRMLSEPRHTQRNEKLIYEFVVLNYVLSANVATIITSRLTGVSAPCPVAYLRPVKRALFTLSDSLHHLDTTYEPAGLPAETQKSKQPAPVGEDASLLEQLQFIQQVSSDIARVVERIN